MRAESLFSEATLQRLEAADRVGWVLTASGALLGFLASIGVYWLPSWPVGALWAVLPALLLLGLAGGGMARWRLAAIDVRRWRIVADDLLTSGEREYAHHEAERQRRVSATAILAGPLAIGYWTAYQFTAADELLLIQLLPLVPMVGCLTGWFAGRGITASTELKIQ